VRDVQASLAFLALVVMTWRRVMKKTLTLIYLVMLILLGVGDVGLAEEFLGAPVMPGGTTVRSGKVVLEKSYDLPAAQVLDFYKGILKDVQDLKYWERSDRVEICEYGNQPWQKIVISENVKGQTLVVIEKDSWTWILGTLTIRFVGVFVVLVVLYGAMAVATRLIMRAEKVPAKKAVLAKPAQVM
jgi:hypothetical protein